jgi:phosphonoacetaldehyde hydrolase
VRSNEIRLVVFDWAGTIIDFGSLAPVEAFIRVFADRGVEVSSAEARAPMGRHKKDHLRAMLQAPAIAQHWMQKHGSAWTEADLEAMYHALVPRQLETVRGHAELVPGLLGCVGVLRSRGIRLGGTTGYFREAANLAVRAAREQGLVLDHNVCGDDVVAGRPAPWMIFRVMERLGIYPPAAVLKVGDTLVDIEEGLNAGVWSAGVTSSSNEMGCSLPEYQALPEDERRGRLSAVAERFRSAGAHAVVESLSELPALIDEINRRLRGEEQASGPLAAT